MTAETDYRSLIRLRDWLHQNPNWTTDQRSCAGASMYADLRQELQDQAFHNGAACKSTGEKAGALIIKTCHIPAYAFRLAVTVLLKSAEAFAKILAGEAKLGKTWKSLPRGHTGSVNIDRKARDAKILELHQQGFVMRQITEMLHLGVESVSNSLRRQGIIAVNTAGARSQSIRHSETLAKFVSALRGCADTSTMIDIEQCQYDQEMLDSMKESIGALQRLHAELRKKGV